MTGPSPAGDAGHSDSGGVNRPLALLIAGALFMEILDSTVIAPAAPHIADDLGVPAVSVNVAITAYLLTLAVLIPISGWLADRLGPRRVLVIAVVVFTLASIGCALATSLTMLTATRVLQGAGGAMMVPVGRLVVLRATAKSDLVTAIAFLTWPALTAPLVAPALGGFLSTYASWRLIFLINVPLGITGAILARRLVPPGRAGDAGPLDWRGFGLTALGVAALSLGIEGAGGEHPTWGTVFAQIAGSATLLVCAAAYMLHTERPLFDLRILRVATYRVTAAGGSVFRAVITAIPFLVPLFLQLGFGWSAAEAGAIMVTLFVGNVGIKPLTTPLMRWFGIKAVMAGALVGSACCLLALANVQPHTPVPLLSVLLCLSGVFRSIGFTTYNTVAFVDVPSRHMTSANTLMSTLQELGAGLGVAVGALLVRVGDPITSAAGYTNTEAPYRFAFVAMALLLAVPGVEAVLMPRSAGNVATGRA
ncbi:MAG: MFS transporter [Dermatophilaceae bacterium]